MNRGPKRIQDNEFAVSPSGLHIGHTKIEVDYLMQIIEREKVEGFMEIGVHIGGLADVLIPAVPNYLGIEINASIINKSIHAMAAASENVHLLIRDAWTDATVWEAAKWIQAKNPVFIYCDGGDKPLELDLYSELARAGDLVGVHDYGVYEGAEIDPEYADALMEERGFIKYESSLKPSMVRIQIWTGK